MRGDVMADHLAKAREYIGRGEEYYGKAADEIIAAMKDDPLKTFTSVDKEIRKYGGFSRKLVTWRTNPGNTEKPTPWAGEYDRVKTSLTRSSLRDAPPEDIAEMMADPKIAANVARAQSIASERTENKSRESLREALGERDADQLEQHVKYQDAAAELFRARRSVIETLRLVDQLDLSELPDSWREELLRTIDDVSEKLEMGRALLAGSLSDADLETLLEA